MKNSIKILTLLLIIVFVSITTSGCGDVFLSFLQVGDKAYSAGDYQKAYKNYKAAAEEYQTKLGKTYTDKSKAEADANIMIEAYFKAGLSAEKVANDPEARAMFEKAVQNARTVKIGYYEKQLVNYPAGYYDRFIPATYKEVWIDGHYIEVKKGDDYEKVWVDGYYDKQDVNGRYEKVWEEAHSKYEDVYKERSAEITITNSYYNQACEKLGLSDVVKTETVSTTTASAAENESLKATQEAMNIAYQNYVKAGAKENGTEFDIYKSAAEKYQKLLEKSQK